MAKKLYGTDPDQVPTNADLGTMAYQDAENPRLNNVVISGIPNDDAYGTLLRVKRGPSESGTWATVAIEAQTANGNSRIAFVNDIEPSPNDAHGMIDFEHQYNRMIFSVDGSEAAHFNNSGNLVFPNGQGIDFSASQGSGASSSILDDYEEGTYTATLDFTSGSVGYSNNTLTYTKIGRVVWVHGRVLLNSVSSPSGSLGITLPFTVSSSGYSRYSHLTASWYVVDVPDNTVQANFTVESGTVARLLYLTDGGAWSIVDASGLASNSQIQVSGFYMT